MPSCDNHARGTPNSQCPDLPSLAPEDPPQMNFSSSLAIASIEQSSDSSRQMPPRPGSRTADLQGRHPGSFMNHGMPCRRSTPLLGRQHRVSKLATECRCLRRPRPGMVCPLSAASRRLLRVRGGRGGLAPRSGRVQAVRRWAVARTCENYRRCIYADQEHSGLERSRNSPSRSPDSPWGRRPSRLRVTGGRRPDSASSARSTLTVAGSPSARPLP